MNSEEQHLATYLIPFGEPVEVYGVTDSDDSQLEDGEFSYYEIYQEGECLTLGNSFNHFPSWQEARQLLASLQA